MILKLCILSFQINGLLNKEENGFLNNKGGSNALYQNNKYTNGFFKINGVKNEFHNFFC